MQTVESGRPPEAAGRATPRWRSDPFRLLDYFSDLHDLQRIKPDTTGTRLYMQAAAGNRAAALTAAFAAVSDAASRRERNAARTLRALYIVGRVNRVPVWWGPSLSSRHEVALRASLRADMRARESTFQTIERLRTAAGEAVAHEETIRRSTQWRDLREWWHATVAPNINSISVTISALDAVQAANVALLSAGALTPEDLNLLDLAKAEARAMAGRIRLASLVLGGPMPLPTIMPFVPDNTPLPREDLPERPLPAAPLLNTAAIHGSQVPVAPDRSIKAAAAGTVVFSGELRGAQNVVIIAHDKGLYSVYSHLGTRTVSEGDRVGRGDPLGRPGLLPAQRETGVHFEVRRGEKPVKAEELLGETPVPVAIGASDLP
ncbi:MAG: M23 family metallopeptidase [Candidatus Sumerlaeaceae bacterium]|nr:M23 family metallopeptidase [Candidatus Sumerlaeaceae bacterium]